MTAWDRPRLLAVAALAAASAHILVGHTTAEKTQAHPEHPTPAATKTFDPSVQLEYELTANEVHGAAKLATALCDLGLRSISDVSHLSTIEEQAELADSLRGTGILLGERNQLRRAAITVKLSHGLTAGQYQSLRNAEAVSRGLQEEEAKKGDSLSMDTITVRRPQATAHSHLAATLLRICQCAHYICSTPVVQIAVTALLGVCSFVLQAKISKAADITQRE
jgi:hypothetical protein